MASVASAAEDLEKVVPRRGALRSAVASAVSLPPTEDGERVVPRRGALRSKPVSAVSSQNCPDASSDRVEERTDADAAQQSFSSMRQKFRDRTNPFCQALAVGQAEAGDEFAEDRLSSNACFLPPIRTMGGWTVEEDEDSMLWPNPQDAPSSASEDDDDAQWAQGRRVFVPKENSIPELPDCDLSAPRKSRFVTLMERRAHPSLKVRHSFCQPFSSDQFIDGVDEPHSSSSTSMGANEEGSQYAKPTADEPTADKPTPQLRRRLQRASTSFQPDICSMGADEAEPPRKAQSSMTHEHLPALRIADDLVAAGSDAGVEQLSQGDAETHEVSKPAAPQARPMPETLRHSRLRHIKRED